MPWLLSEDAALKVKLSGLTVQGAALPNPIPVVVRFTVPEDEYSDITYPLITITQADIQRDPERESRGFTQLQSLPEGFDPSQTWYADMPIPHNIDYQIDLYTRLVEHRTPLLRTLCGFNYLPERFGYLAVPQDSTVRRLDVLGGPDLSSGRDSDGKRLFTATWRIRVSTELYLLGDPVMLPSVESVDLTVDDYDPGYPG
jgi:hypothetical protein